MSILQTTELKKYYGTKPNITKALDGVNLSVEQGEFVAIVGTSGSGKSTLLNMIGGLDVPTSGKVIVDGRDLSTLKDEQLTIFRRRKIGFIFQNYNLVPVLNVYENIVLPVELDGNKVDKKFMKEVVRMLGLEDKLNNMPSNLSGGQQQRVAIARALVSKPAIVLADEPTGNLDSMTSSDVLSLLKVTSTKFHQTLVMITHNNEIAQLADRIIRIVLLNSVFIVSGSFDEDAYIENQSRSDFRVYSPGIQAAFGNDFGHNSAVPEKAVEEIKAQPGVTSEVYLYRNTFEDDHISCDWGTPYVVDSHRSTLQSSHPV